MAEIPVVVGYRLGGVAIDAFPNRAADLEAVEPIYETWPGWSDATREGMKPFLDRLREHIDCDVSLISNGPARSEVDR